MDAPVLGNVKRYGIAKNSTSLVGTPSQYLVPKYGLFGYKPDKPILIIDSRWSMTSSPQISFQQRLINLIL